VTTASATLRPLRRRVRLAVRRRRRTIAALCAAASVATGLSAVAPPAPDTVPVVTASRDLAAGTLLGDGDLRVVRVPRHLAPSAVLAAVGDAVGRALAGAVRRGEALTDVRLAGAGLLSGLPAGHVAVPLRLADAGALGLVQPGDRVDVHAVAVADAGAAAASVADLVVDDLLVVDVPGRADDPLAEGGLLVVAASRETARLLARAAAAARFSIAVRAPR
jgi:Flp pilus assembly protein CpaB